MGRLPSPLATSSKVLHGKSNGLTSIPIIPEFQSELLFSLLFKRLTISNGAMSLPVGPRVPAFFTIKGVDDVVVFRSKDISWDGQPVRISSDWAEFLTPTFIDTNISVFNSLMNPYGLETTQGSPQSIIETLQATIGSLMASGMMNVGYDSSVDWPTLLQHKYLDSEFYPDPSSPGFPNDRSLFDIPESLTRGKFAASYRMWVAGPVYSTKGIPVKTLSCGFDCLHHIHLHFHYLCPWNIQNLLFCLGFQC